MDRKGAAVVVLCVIFIIAWQFYIGPNYFPVEKRSPQPGKTRPEPPGEESIRNAEVKKDAPVEKAAAEPAPKIEEEEQVAAEKTEQLRIVSDQDARSRDMELENSVMSVTLTTRGGCIKSLSLKNFKDDNGDPLVLIDPLRDDFLPLNLRLIRPDANLHLANYVVSQSDRSMAEFKATVSNGLEVRKRFEISPDRYDFTFSLVFINTSSEPIEFLSELTGPGSIIREDKKQPYVTGAAGYMKNQKPESASPKLGKTWQVPRQITYEGVTTSDIDLVYIGVRNRFFASAMLAKQSMLVRGLTSVSVRKEEDKDKKNADETISTGIVMAPVRLEPGRSAEYAFTFYSGPKKADILAEYGPLSNLLDYGWFGAISKFLLLLLRFFYGITGNYGISIILITIIVKLALFPLSRKGAVSQAKQQKLAPQMKELQEKYKSNKQKLHEETMKLYKAEGVNPLGGCLPLLLQIPVFIGLLRLLQYAIELRQAVFIPGWIEDLSKPDTVAMIPQFIPFIGGGNLNILPLIMGAVSIIHQKMMPKPADPQAQQQMMMMRFMPLMFVFLLYNWPSGLLLYWTMSSSISILEQYLLKRNLGR